MPFHANHIIDLPPIHITSSLYNTQPSRLDSPDERAAFLTHQMMEDDAV